MTALAAPVRARAPRTALEPRNAPKQAYGAFTLPHFRRWASDLILDTGESWHPEDFQEAFVEDVFAGFPEAWLIVPEGNGKTTLLAGLALYHCEHRPFAAVPVAAASREQAEILYRQAEGFVLRSDMLHTTVHSAIAAAKGKRKTDVPRFLCLEGYRRINHHSGSRIQVFAADDRTGDGIIPTLGIIDEPHRLRDLGLYRTWAGKLAKRDGQLAAISTSGEPDSDFETTRERIRLAATDATREGSFTRATTSRVVLHEWAVPETDDPDDMDVVKRANPFSGITVDMLREKHDSPTMTRHHWMRFVCNRPTRDSDTWLGPNAEKVWGDLADPWEPVDDAPTWVGVDVGIKRDSTAVVHVQRRPDGKLHAWARLWMPEPDRPVDVSDVMTYIRGLADSFALKAVAFDPRFFDVPAAMLGDSGLPMVIVPQSPERMTKVIGSLLEAIKRSELRHSNDRNLSTHVLNAVPRVTEGTYTLKKGNSRGKIDACIALALAVDQAVQHKGKPKPELFVGFA